MSNWQQAQQQRGYGATPNQVEERKNKTWQDALQAVSMAALAKGADTQTMFGYALGKFLANYLNRGQDKRDAQNAWNIANGVNGQQNSLTGAEAGYENNPERFAVGLMGDSNSLNNLLNNNDDYYRGKNGFFAG